MRGPSSLITGLAAIIFLSLAACEKTGPQGPAGAAGPVGPAGPTGPQGPQGPAGTANVVYSRWTNGSAWTLDGTTGLVFFNMSTTSLTQSILSNGIIHVYWAVLGDTAGHVRELPFVESVGGTVYFHNPKYSVGNIRIEASNTSMAPSNRYRYILIPGGVLGGRSSIDFSNYREVLRELGIPE